MTFDAKATGARIIKLRQDRGISAVKAAMELHLSESMYRKIENGERGLSLDVLLAIAEYYQTSTDYILTGRRVVSEIEEELSRIISSLQILQKRI